LLNRNGTAFRLVTESESAGPMSFPAALLESSR